MGLLPHNPHVMRNLKTAAMLATMFGGCCIAYGNTFALPEHQELWALGGAGVLLWSFVIFTSLPKYKKLKS